MSIILSLVSKRIISLSIFIYIVNHQSLTISLYFPSIEGFKKRHYLHNLQDFWGRFLGHFGWGLGLFYKGGGYQKGGIILKVGIRPLCTLSSKLNCGSNIISFAKTASKKIGALICSMKFLSEVALYLNKSTICPCMEYCCHVWAGAPSCYLELLDKLQKWVYGTVGPSLAASLEPLTHCQNVASLSLFYRYYL